MKYILDANVFISAHRSYYSFDIVPSFWRSLVKLAEDNKVISIDRIKSELLRSDKEDDLVKWAVNEFNRWFVTTDDSEVIRSYAEIMQWSFNQEQYVGYAKAEFAEVADSWLIAYAKAYNYCVITHEQYAPDAKNRILIPNVCEAFSIPYMNTFEMMRELNTTL